MSNQEDFKILSQEFSDSPPPTVGNPNSAGIRDSLSSPITPCSYCGNKRHSPDSPVFPAENSKKLFIKPEHNNPFDFSHITLPDFSKIALNSTQDHGVQSPSSLPVLRRCFSDPCNPPMSNPNPVSLIPVTQSPPRTTPVSKATAPLPPRPPIRRCSSDISEYNKSSSPNSNAKETSVDGNLDSQLQKRMRNCVKEMNQCLDEMLVEREATLMTDAEDTVSVERNGGCLTVHLNCSCSKRFDILLSGNDCYYKLH